MLQNLKQNIEDSWYQRTRWWTFLLLPLSALFILISFLRRVYYRYFSYLFGGQKFAVPVIVVGNITVGGTGKTPLVIYLAKLLQAQGYCPGIVSRGYGRQQQECCEVTANSDPLLVGDEPVLIAQRTEVPVMVGRKRAAVVQQLLAQSNCNVIISDDGLQHYALARDIEIAVIDGVRRFGNGFRLPAGPLRESIKRLQTVDFVVATGKAKAGEYALQLKLGLLQNMRNGEQKSLDHWHGQKIIAVAGIGNNQRFFDLLISNGLQIIPKGFPDHHVYQATDFSANLQMPIIMTEKDAVKCTSFATENFWYLPVTAELGSEFSAKILGKLKNIKRSI